MGLLIPAAVSVSNTGLPTSIIELNDKFLDVMNSGFWFVEVRYLPKITVISRTLKFDIKITSSIYVIRDNLKSYIKIEYFTV